MEAAGPPIEDVAQDLPTQETLAAAFPAEVATGLNQTG